MQTKRAENIADAFFPLVFRIAQLRRERIGHARFGDAVVAVDARHFLQHIRETDNALANVEAVRRSFRFDNILLDRAFELETREQFGDLFRREFDAKQAFDVFRRDGNRRVFRLERIFVHKPGRDNSARPLRHELKSTLNALLSQGRMHAARESERRFRRQVVLSRRLASVDRIPIRAFEQDGLRFIRHFRFKSTHDSSQRERAFFIAHEHVCGCQCPFSAVERGKFFPVFCGAGDDFDLVGQVANLPYAPHEHIIIKRV